MAINIMDIDGDGKPDILTGNNGNGSISILHNKAVTGGITQASFDAKVDISVQAQSGFDYPVNDIGLGDIDGDGRPEMVVITDSV